MTAVRALLVLASPPLPEGGAPGRHAIALIRGLRAHGVDVHTIAAAQYFSGSPPPDLGVEVVPVDGARGRRTGRFRPGGRRTIDAALGERVRDAAKDVDVIHLEQVETARLGRESTVPSVLHIHYRISLDRPLGPLWSRETRWIAKRALAERAALRDHRFLLASSPLVASSLAAGAPHAEVVHASLSLDGNLYPPAPLAGPPTAGIIGSAAWTPTREATIRLVQRVWPRVRERVPDARLLVAGIGTTSLPGGDGVEMLGEVPSAAEFLRGLSVLVFPLERGSGMKVKVLESLACGVPVVTTAAGAEGIDANAGVAVTDSDDELASATASLLLDPAEAARRGEAARAVFLARYSPVPATAPVVDLYRRMIAG
jgi:glycosyltransferase involved in cell wall biosynthesis